MRPPRREKYSSHCSTCSSTLRRSPAPSAPATSPPERTENRRACPEQESEVIPAPTSRVVVERELLPPAENVHDEDDPGRKAVPEPPKQIRPPHDDLLLLISVPGT